jgi:hypothetical protein
MASEVKMKPPTHTLTISGLDDFEAEHISSILHGYKTNCLVKQLTSMVEDSKDGGNRTEWYEKHTKWHEKIMAKVKWKKE